jgi:hypothetical protein
MWIKNKIRNVYYFTYNSRSIGEITLLNRINKDDESERYWVRCASKSDASDFYFMEEDLRLAKLRCLIKLKELGWNIKKIIL